MADYIDKQKTIEAIHSAIYSYFCGAEDGDELSEDEKLVLSVNKSICTAIRAFPSADVQPVRHGHWEIFAEGRNFRFMSSECDYSEVHAYEDSMDCVNFCQHCGARMDKGSNQ